MSELKAYIAPAPDEKGLAEYYLKSEADKVIEEKDAEIARLKATPEEIMKEVFDKVLIYPHDMVRLEDAYRLAVSLRKTKRALYKACANWAHFAVAFFSSYVTKNRWRWMELKCLKKAEKYK